MRKRQLAMLPLNDSTPWIVCHATADPHREQPCAVLARPGVLYNAAVTAGKGLQRPKVIFVSRIPLPFLSFLDITKYPYIR